MINKKYWIFGAVILVLLITVVIILQEKTEVDQPKEQEKTIIKIASPPTSIGITFPFFVAQEKGFFDKYDLEIQSVNVAYPAIVAALLAKDIDYSLYPAVTAILKGAPLKTVMVFSKDPFIALSGQPGLELKDLKTIGIAFRYTLNHYQTLKLIDENNLSAEIITANGEAATLQALLIEGKVDAAVHGTLTAIQFQEEGYPILKIYDGEAALGLVVRNDKIENDPEEVEKVIRALQSGIEFIKNNPEDTKELFFKFSNLEKNEVNQKIVEEIYPIAREAFSEEGISAKEINDLMIKLSKADAFETVQDVEQQTVTDEDIAKVFDFRFLK